MDCYFMPARCAILGKNPVVDVPEPFYGRHRVRTHWNEMEPVPVLTIIS